MELISHLLYAFQAPLICLVLFFVFFNVFAKRGEFPKCSTMWGTAEANVEN
jgi:hypothetical protein